MKTKFIYPAVFEAEAVGGFVARVDMDMLDYKQKHDNRAIKKTLAER